MNGIIDTLEMYDSFIKQKTEKEKGSVSFQLHNTTPIIRRMKRVKDLKVGDKVYSYCAYLSPDAGFVVKSIKKQKTLAIVTIDWNVFGKHKDVICYGHVSGELLVYNGAGWDSNIPLVCDFDRIIEKTKEYEKYEGLRWIGLAVKEFVSALKKYAL